MSKAVLPSVSVSFWRRGVEVLRVLEDGVDGVGGLERDGELVAEAGAIRGGEKWSERRDHGNRGEAEIAPGCDRFLRGA